MVRGSREKRSLAAPNWTRQECITLVNEINAVEGVWQHTLSSFQIWQLVVENCNALHLNRSLNQCKKKWAALLADFKKVKSRRRSYRSFDSDVRKELDLPEEFDRELFRAINVYLKQKDDDGHAAGPDSDPTTDQDIQRTAVNKVFWDNGPKKKRRKITPRKRKFGERYQPWGGSIIGKMKNEPSISSEVPELPVKNIFADVIL